MSAEKERKTIFKKQSTRNQTHIMSEMNILMAGSNSRLESAEIGLTNLKRGHRSEPVLLNLENVTMPPFAGFSLDSFVWHMRLLVTLPGQVP